MIDTFAMQARRRELPSSIKMHMRMDERSGLYVSNSVNGAQYDPSSVAVSNPALYTTGSIAFGVTNAVTITNNDEQLPTLCDFDCTIDLSKIVILASCIKMNGTTGTRTAIGTAGETNTLTNSVYGGLHGGLRNDMSTSGAFVNPLAGYELLDNTVPYVHYVMWNGVDTATLKVVNLSGAVYNNGTNNLLRTVTTASYGVFNVSTLTLGNMSRLNGGHYYGITCWQLEKTPQSLDLKLANWGNLLVAGHKGAIDLR